MAHPQLCGLALVVVVRMYCKCAAWAHGMVPPALACVGRAYSCCASPEDWQAAEARLEFSYGLTVVCAVSCEVIVFVSVSLGTVLGVRGTRQFGLRQRQMS